MSVIFGKAPTKSTPAPTISSIPSPKNGLIPSNSPGNHNPNGHSDLGTIVGGASAGIVALGFTRTYSNGYNQVDEGNEDQTLLGDHSAQIPDGSAREALGIEA